MNLIARYIGNSKECGQAQEIFICLGVALISLKLLAIYTHKALLLPTMVYVEPMSNVATWSAITIRCCSWNTYSDHVVPGMFTYWDVLLRTSADIHCFRLQLIAGYKTPQNFDLLAFVLWEQLHCLAIMRTSVVVLCFAALQLQLGYGELEWNRNNNVYASYRVCMYVCMYVCM